MQWAEFRELLGTTLRRRTMQRFYRNSVRTPIPGRVSASELVLPRRSSDTDISAPVSG